MNNNTSMSKIVEYINSQKDAECGKGATTEEILELESVWGGKLPVDYSEFLQTVGWAAYGSTEIPGLGRSIPKHLNVLNLANLLWDGPARLPKELLPVFDSGGGWYYCISRLHPDFPIVLWALEYGSEQPFEEQFSSWTQWFQDYLMN